MIPWFYYENQWDSNSSDFVKTVPQEHRARASSKTKILGLAWDINRDIMHLNIKENLLYEQRTKNIQLKRKVLSTIASIIHVDSITFHFTC